MLWLLRVWRVTACPGRAPHRAAVAPSGLRRALGACALLLLLSACGKTPLTVEVGGGVLRGYLDDGVEYYLGIPYAQAPVGDLRWRPPQPVPPWRGELPVQENPGGCPQFVPLLDTLSGDEDCLYLNVWTPADKPAAAMPVMVWIHGGGFIAGRGSFTAEDGRALAESHQVVVVTLNYRLGVFGFLAHRALSREDADHPGSGNYGIEDQTAALRWVRDNIGAFGGDPQNVTIFGQSAGAVSVCAQLVSPQAAGLFQRAIIQSGPCATGLSSLAGASAVGATLAAKTGCAGEGELACLRARSTGEIARALPADPTFAFGEGYTVWWPVLDGQVLPVQMLDAFKSGDFNRVPVINGSTRDEATLLVWLSHNLVRRPLEPQQYLERLAYLVGGSEPMAQRIARRYPLADYDDVFTALSVAFSDGFFHCPTRHQSRALARHVPTWEYSFDYRHAPFLVPWVDLGAYHAAEIQYVFGKPMSFLRRAFRQEEQPLAASMMAHWAAFARSGAPDPGQRPRWPRYGSDEKALIFNLQNSLASGLYDDTCAFWEGLTYLTPAYP
ncbi:MAG: carboxylesterase family protein [Halioglobus sp.]|nr:carboxylesterase family protein [Halioglobus sp.]